MITAARIIAEIAELDPADAPAVLAAVAARLAARPALPMSAPGPDRKLNARQVAERLNLSTAWVRDHAETDLATARIKLGGALRFSEAALEELIRRRQGG